LSYFLLILSLLSACLLSLPFISSATGIVLFVAFLPLLYIEELLFRRQNKSSMFNYAFVSFFVFNAIALWWSYKATFMAIFAVLLNALFMSLVFCLFHYFRTKSKKDLAYFTFPLFWLSFEYLHYKWEFAFPWLNLGNGFSEDVQLIQWYEYTGVQGGSLLILIVNSLLHTSLQYFKPKFSNLKFVLNIVFIIIILLSTAYVSEKLYKKIITSTKKINVCIVQTNASPFAENYNNSLKEKHLIEIIENILQKNENREINLIVAPEATITEVQATDDFENSAIIKLLQTIMYEKFTNTKLLVGCYLSEKGRKYNSSIVVDKKGVTSYSHKAKLLVGVERMPFAQYFEFMNNYIVALGSDNQAFSEPAEVRNLPIDSFLIAPVICWESVFGAYVGNFVKNDAQLIAVITNDGWWQHATGNLENLHISRLRAIETRRTVVRAANTGISAKIDMKGNIQHKCKIATTEFLLTEAELNCEKTFYVKHGDYIGFLALLALFAIIIYENFTILYFRFRKKN